MKIIITILKIISFSLSIMALILPSGYNPGKLVLLALTLFLITEVLKYKRNMN